MLDTKIRYKLDVLLEEEGAVYKAPKGKVGWSVSRKKEVAKKAPALKISKIQAERVIKRVERI